jgi:hypothetical protein
LEILGLLFILFETVTLLQCFEKKVLNHLTPDAELIKSFGVFVQFLFLSLSSYWLTGFPEFQPLRSGK